MPCDITGPYGQVGTLTVELGLARRDVETTAALWDTTLWDATGEGWSSSAVEWVDITEDVRAVDVDEGATSLTDRIRSRTCSLELLNDDGAYTADTGAPSPGLVDLRPGTPVRVSVASTVGPERRLFTGYVTTLRHPLTAQGTDRLRVSCNDALLALGRIDPPGLTPAGNGDTYAERIARILDHADTDVVAGVDVTYGVSTFQSTSLAQPTLTELLLTADSEGGFVYVDRDGVLVGRGFDWLTTAPRSTSPRATLGMFPYPDYPDLELVCPSRVTTADLDLGRIWNEVRLARAGGSQYVAVDTTSQGLYGRLSGPTRNDLVVDDDERVIRLAERRVRWRADPTAVVDGIDYRSVNTPADLDVLTGLEQGDLVAFTYRNIAFPSYTLTGLAHVVGSRWTLRPGDAPSVEFRIDSASAVLRERQGWDGADWDDGLWDAEGPGGGIIGRRLSPSTVSVTKLPRRGKV